MSWRVVDDGVTVRFVCSACNNGWMSDVESGTKPVIERMLRDGHETLTLADQSSLAMWAIKNAMVFEALRSDGPRFYSEQERRAFRDSRTLPRPTTVWVAKCVNQPHAYTSALDLGGVVDGSGERMHAYVTTMAFGCVALQVLSGKLPPDVARTVTVTAELRPGPWDDVVIRIWPTSTEELGWPNRMGLDGDVGIEALSERWSPPDPDSLAP